ncbi:hypothetical protein [Haloarcula argentinensis]|uniref:Uncharacterized protein n=1 Tax=Haloarcula argentinensis TaxID=43776 RepID=A0A847UT15_HALAR|nr:hypothetical protein [Haloarcula argentinensis]NLV15188.1 hypothetical protein [Haloarcula argentinensis]
MIDAVVALVQEFGLVASGGLGVLSAGLWLRRLDKVATWFRVGGLVTVLVGVGALAGVVNLGRLWIC